MTFTTRIISVHENQAFFRTELEIEVSHPGLPIPSRQEIFEDIRANNGEVFPPEIVGAIISQFNTSFGSHIFRITLFLYVDHETFNLLNTVERYRVTI